MTSRLPGCCSRVCSRRSPASCLRLPWRSNSFSTSVSAPPSLVLPPPLCPRTLFGYSPAGFRLRCLASVIGSSHQVWSGLGDRNSCKKSKISFRAPFVPGPPPLPVAHGMRLPSPTCTVSMSPTPLRPKLPGMYPQVCPPCCGASCRTTCGAETCPGVMRSPLIRQRQRRRQRRSKRRTGGGHP